MLQPPTDNLYKFMAIIGLMLWIGGALYPWQKAYEMERELITLQAEIKYAQEFPSEAKPIELEKKVKLIRLLYKSTVAYFAIGILSLAVGGFLMLYGFKYWYIRVQKPLDEKMKKQA